MSGISVREGGLGSRNTRVMLLLPSLQEPLLLRCSSTSSSSSPNEWRKKQLEKIEKKFDKTDTAAAAAASMMDIHTDDELQPMWKEMEGRVVRRKPRTAAQLGGRTGRVNVRKTDEEVWLEKGLYDTTEQVVDDDETKKDDDK